MTRSSIGALKGGIKYIITIGIDLASSLKGLELAKKHDFLYSSIGYHPHAANDMDTDKLKSLGRMVSETKVVAWGEIGLDFYRQYAPHDKQIEGFKRQLEMGMDFDLPVIIHNRDAHKDTIEMLRDWLSSPRSRGRAHPVGVMHCFSGSLEMAKQMLDLGFMIGIDGPITFSNARKLPEIVARVPLESILLETDCPYLAPQPHRGKRNEPAYLPMIAQRVAEIRGISVEEVARVTTASACALFRLGNRG